MMYNRPRNVKYSDALFPVALHPSIPALYKNVLIIEMSAYECIAKIGMDQRMVPKWNTHATLHPCLCHWSFN